MGSVSGSSGIDLRQGPRRNGTLEETELVRRYKRNYGLHAESEVSEEMIRRHWDLERALTKRLLESNPADRPRVFAECYTELYRELSWLNRLVVEKSREEKRREFAGWAEAIGPGPVRIYEVGSGRGELIEYLAECGHDCTGSEITQERGQSLLGEDGARIRWHAGDGVHLSRFEEKGSYDVVITNQLIEHLHPEDLERHFVEARVILRRGGRYILSTPHRLTGPHDVSRIFDRPTAEGMHLKEYTYRDLIGALKRAGFRDVYHAGQRRRLQERLGGLQADAVRVQSLIRVFTTLLLISEGMLHLAPRRLRTPAAHNLHRLGVFSENIFLVATH